jgi:hypothetical protein
MMILALITRPWILYMQQMGATPRTLADDRMLTMTSWTRSALQWRPLLTSSTTWGGGQAVPEQERRHGVVQGAPDTAARPPMG